MNDLEYFVGRVCTIFTTPINRNYKDENPSTFIEMMHNYFTGYVDKVTDDGVWMTQIAANNPLKSFFFIRNIIGISEERALNPENPQEAKEIEEFKSKSTTAKEKVEKIQEMIKPQQGQYVDPAALAQMAEAMQQTHGKD